MKFVNLNKTNTTLAVTALVALSLAMAQTAQAQYVAVDLTPAPGVLMAPAQAYGADNGQQVGFGSLANGNSHALLWPSSAIGFVDLHPGGMVSSLAVGIGDGQQAGYGLLSNGNFHALLWTGSAASAIDLNPPSWASQAFAAAGGQQVGFGTLLGHVQGRTTQAPDHALLWASSATSVVDLHPSQYVDSRARGVSQGTQVGYGDVSGLGQIDPHALLWYGSAQSVVDLHPAGFINSEAWAVSGSQQVGFATLPNGSITHALLWAGSAASVVDLHPSAYVYSAASAINGGKQAGYGFVADPNAPVLMASVGLTGYTHALIWSGSANSVIDLNQFLPAGYTDAVASGVDAQGNIVGAASGPATQGVAHAFLWKPGSSSIAGPPTPSDAVAVTRAEYTLSTKVLLVQATSTNATATLTVSVTSTGTQIGTLTNVGGGKYQFQGSWSTNPLNVTVKSSLGGSASLTVTLK